MYIASTIKKYLILLTISLWFVQRLHIVKSQVVSYELRRLAVSTNHFGFDVLRALDRIEPPEKVIVFCPLCLSSSLSMIIMGSSRYEVISALRHALYIWSMRPKEINKAYLDMFNHVGLNQISSFNTRRRSLNLKEPETSTTSDSYPHRIEHIRPSSNEMLNLEQFSNIYSTRRPYQSWSTNEDDGHQFSLPKLMYLRERGFEKFLPQSSYKYENATLSQQQANQHSTKSDKFVSPDTELPTGTSLNDFNHHRAGMTIDSAKLGSSTLSQMSSVQSIYVQRGINIDYNYQALLRHYYKTGVHPVDFLRNGEETRQHINSLVARSTESKIKEIISAEKMRQKSIGMLLISAFHFRGTLDVFMKDSRDLKRSRATSNHSDKRTLLSNTSITLPEHAEISHRLYQRSPNISFINKNKPHLDLSKSSRRKNEPVFIETESTLLKFGLNKDLDCKTIEIPFKNRLISLVIVMPNNDNSTGMLLAKLNAQVLADMINSLEVKRLAIQIPVIKFDRGPTNVEGALKELGLSEIFYGGDRRLVTINETGLNKWMRPSDLIHETSIDIGTINPKFYQAEDRLKLGVSSKVKFPFNNIDSTRVRQGRSRQEPTTIRLSGNFLYFVLDGINGLIMTMGRVRQ